MGRDNKVLQRAKDKKNDEFFTQLADIERELRHYREYFKDAVIFCNCDDPEYSNFWKYFQLNFYEFGLKKLISTHYETEIPSYKMEIVRTDEKEQVGIPDYVKTPLKQNGDFRSPECIEILKEADIVITNPPFSLFIEYITQLIEYNKKFIIIAPLNSIHYKDVFPLIKNNIIWTGYGFQGGNAYFETKEIEHFANGVIDKNTGLVKFGNTIWLTNLDISKRHKTLQLYKTYNPEEYPKYLNFDGIHIKKVEDIPVDYDGYMGVPDGFVEYHNPDQFEIVGLGCGDMAKEIGIKKNYRGRTDLAYIKNGKPSCPYSRIIIRRVAK